MTSQRLIYWAQHAYSILPVYFTIPRIPDIIAVSNERAIILQKGKTMRNVFMNHELHSLEHLLDLHLESELSGLFVVPMQLNG